MYWYYSLECIQEQIKYAWWHGQLKVFFSLWAELSIGLNLWRKSFVYYSN